MNNLIQKSSKYFPRCFFSDAFLVLGIFFSQFCGIALADDLSFSRQEVSLQDMTRLTRYFGLSSAAKDSEGLAGFSLEAFNRAKIKNTLGSYSGTFNLTKSNSFNGASCTPTSSFPALFTVSGPKKKPQGQLGNIPIAFSGRATKSGAKLRGTFTSDGITRNYTMLISKVKKTSAKLTFTEVLKSGSLKACLFKHSGVFSRS
ncbi:MAG: hypothetical protein KDD70_09220 [Bdellovibrionales bacterium]|nr:hypothetical protein [Bdellovibrionales bacterium]